MTLTKLSEQIKKKFSKKLFRWSNFIEFSPTKNSLLNFFSKKKKKRAHRECAKSNFSLKLGKKSNLVKKFSL